MIRIFVLRSITLFYLPTIPQMFSAMISLSEMKANVIDIIHFPTSCKKYKISRLAKLWFSLLRFPRERRRNVLKKKSTVVIIKICIGSIEFVSRTRWIRFPFTYFFCWKSRWYKLTLDWYWSWRLKSVGNNLTPMRPIDHKWKVTLPVYDLFKKRFR